MKITGVEQTAERLREIIKRSNHLNPVLHAATQVLDKNAIRTFKQQGLSPQSWKPLSKRRTYRYKDGRRQKTKYLSYYERVQKANDNPERRLERGSTKITSTPHRLIWALTKRTSSRKIVQISRNRLIWGVKNLAYARAMQKGNPKQKVAARPYMSWWQYNIGRSICRMIVRYVRTGKITLPKSVGGLEI